MEVDVHSAPGSAHVALNGRTGPFDPTIDKILSDIRKNRSWSVQALGHGRFRVTNPSGKSREINSQVNDGEDRLDQLKKLTKLSWNCGISPKPPPRDDAPAPTETTPASPPVPPPAPALDDEPVGRDADNGETPVKIHQCTKCVFADTSPAALKSHLHHTKRGGSPHPQDEHAPYPCPEEGCYSVRPTLDSLLQHLRSPRHNRTGAMCREPLCLEWFDSELLLFKHQETTGHTSGAPRKALPLIDARWRGGASSQVSADGESQAPADGGFGDMTLERAIATIAEFARDNDPVRLAELEAENTRLRDREKELTDRERELTDRVAELQDELTTLKSKMRALLG